MNLHRENGAKDRFGLNWPGGGEQDGSLRDPLVST
jgi:hypothetical protein